MGFTRVCTAGEVGAGQMTAFFIDGCEVLVVRDTSGALHAMDGICPHEDFPLVYGELEGDILTCVNHFWSFDATTGRGINPPSCRLEQYAVKVDGDDVYVDTEGEASAPPA